MDVKDEQISCYKRKQLDEGTLVKVCLMNGTIKEYNSMVLEQCIPWPFFGKRRLHCRRGPRIQPCSSA